MGGLRKGGVWIEKNYISAREKALADLLELKKQESVRMQEPEKNWLMKNSKFGLQDLILPKRDSEEYTA